MFLSFWYRVIERYLSFAVGPIFFNFHPKNHQITSKHGYKYRKLQKRFGCSSGHTLNLSDLIKTKVLSLVKWCFNKESKTYICTSDKVGFFSNKEYDLYNWTCTELCEAFTFLVENIYVQCYGITGILMGTNYAPLIVD